MGILSGPIDMEPQKRKVAEYPRVHARLGMQLAHRATGVNGALISWASAKLVLRDAHGRDHAYRPADGDFLVGGKPVALRPPKTNAAEVARRTASGSIDVGAAPARLARASRIYVEGIHDAELVERVWGDDLRVEGVVVEHLGGMDDLEMVVRTFGPGPRRRLGVLLDHLVEGTKERRVASRIDHPDVLITGHPYVDIWQAVKPRVIGLDAWPTVPRGEPWKEGVCRAIGWRDSTAAFWKHLRSKVTSYADLEPGLIGAVEQLIDFVAPPE